MNRARLILAIRFCTLATVCLWLGVPWYMTLPIALLPSVLGVNNCSSCCTATAASLTASMSIGGITNNVFCSNCNDYNIGVVTSYNTCGGSSVGYPPNGPGCGGGISGLWSLSCGAVGDPLSVAGSMSTGWGGSASGSANFGTKPDDCSVFSVSLTLSQSYSNAGLVCDFSGALVNVSASN